MSGIIVDIGTGDGKFAYQLAKENPDRFVIGIDPSHPSLEKTSSKIYKKVEKGGLKNALFVIANIEDLPDELVGVANQIFVILPWSGLLEGIIAAKKNVLENTKKICQKGAVIEIVLGYRSEEGEKAEIPELSEDLLREKTIPGFSKVGFDLLELREIKKEELNEIPSTWAKRLKLGKERKFFYLKFKAR